MSYQTGTYASSNDLVTTLATFLGANGWTIDMNTIDPGGWVRLHIHQGSDYIHIRSVNSASTGVVMNGVSAPFNGVAAYPSDSYNGANAWGDQPGNAGTIKGMFLSTLDTAGTYHFFTYPGSTEVYVVIEYTPSKFQLLCFGQILRYDASETRCNFLFGAANSSSDIGTNEHIPFRSTAQGGIPSQTVFRNQNSVGTSWVFPAYGADGIMGGAILDEALIPYTKNSFSWQTSMLPLILYYRAGLRIRPAGELQFLRRLDITAYPAGSELTLGSETWVVFPYHQKNVSTGTYGYAVKKVL